MYSFRLNKDLVDNAKKIAKNMDISLSLFISCLIKEKISNLNSLEYNFIELTHKFSIEQIELESDFTNALNDLFLSKKGNKPSKQRF